MDHFHAHIAFPKLLRHKLLFDAVSGFKNVIWLEYKMETAVKEISDDT